MKCFLNICKVHFQVSCGLIWTGMSIILISHCYNSVWKNLVKVLGVYCFCILESNNFNEEGLSTRLLQFIYSSELCKLVQQSWMVSLSLDRCLFPAGLCIFATILQKDSLENIFIHTGTLGASIFSHKYVCIWQMVHINYTDWLSFAIKFY